ncbi:MAG: AMP-binding protein [Burkholderiaceae bacterium]
MSDSSRALGHMRVGNLLTTAAIRYGGQQAFYCAPTGRRFTFRQLDERVNRLANALLALGLRKGDRVAFLSTNRIEVVDIYLAIARTGLVGLPLNYRLAPVEMRALVGEVGACALIVERRFADALPVVREGLSGERRVIALGEPAGGAGPDGATAGGDGPILDYDELCAGAGSDDPGIDIDEHDPYYFNLTSGTTGLPKCYLISHYNAASFLPMFQALHVDERDVLMTVFPMYGRVGFAWVACGLIWGNRNVLMNFDVGEALRLIEAEQVTMVNLVPTMGAMLLASPALARSDLHSLRGIVFAGSLLPAPVREGIQARVCPQIYEYYGMQETSTLVVSTPRDRVRRPDSVGRPILFAELRIVDEAGRDVPVGQTGAVIGRSPGTVAGYFNNPGKTAETFRDGWLHTGDLGRLDDEGYLYINGRLKDVIVTGGQNVHAGEVEEAILGCDGVADCAVVGLPDPLWGEVVTAIVVPHDGRKVSEAEVIAHCRASLAGFKTPKRVLIRDDALPRTPTGKVQKFRLVEQYAPVEEKPR